MKKAFYYPALICLVFSTATVFAQDIQNTLLWRISGKGMPAPSYLFGTIHLQDRRVFNLPDSLYSAMDRTEVFSLEVNADSINSDLSAYYTKMFEDLDKPEDKKLKNVLDKKELDELQQDLGDDEQIKAGELTVRQAYLLKEKLVKPKKKADDMPTFLDAYLYRMAKDKGKQIAGLERLQDQMDLLENIPEGDIDIHEVYKTLRRDKTVMEGLVQRYLAADLKAIQGWYRMLPDETEDKLLTRRNRKMVRSMDSIMKHHSLLAAVGTAHLPGKAGLIQLLRAEGYTVEPVFSSTYTHAANYKFSSGTSSWVDVIAEDDGYRVRMPGVPSQVDAGDGLVKMRIYVDLATSEVYYTCHVALPVNPDAGKRDSMMDAWAHATISKLRSGPLKTTHITTNGVSGKQYLFSGSDKNNYRVDILGKDRDMFLLMSSNKNDKHNSADSFHSSFRAINRAAAVWARQDLAEEYVSVRMPGKPKSKMVYSEDSTIQQVNYNVYDAATGVYYYVSVNKTTPGYAYTGDSAMIKDIEERMGEKGDFSAKEIKQNGCNATDYKYSGKDGRLLKGRIIHRGNRIYNILAETEDNAAGQTNVDEFLNSVTLTPYPLPVYSTYESPGGIFKTTAPAPFAIKKDSNREQVLQRLLKMTAQQGDADSTVHYISWDKERLIGYDVLAEKLSTYYWSTNDTATMQYWLKNSKAADDSLTNIRVYKKGKQWIGEATGLLQNAKQIHRIKAIRDGRTLYVLRCKVPQFAADDKGIDAFFSNFSVLKPDHEDIGRSPAAFFKDLHSADSAVYSNATEQLDDVAFTKTDIPVLLEEATKVFVLDTANDDKVRTNIISRLRDYKDDVPVNSFVQLYNNLPAGQGVARFSVLNILGTMKDSVAAYRAVKQLMLKNPPGEGHPYMIKFTLDDHPQLLKTFYPDWLQLAGDSISGGAICDMAVELLDSNVISIASLQPALPSLLADSRMVRLRASSGNWYTRSIPELLSRYNTKEAWDEVAAYQSTPNNILRYTAVRLLLEHKQTPASQALDSLAADKSYRRSLYDLLQEQKHADLFPKQFLTQQYFAESRMCDYTEDDDFDYIRPMGERTALYKGKMSRFFLFEMKYDAADEDTYLGIAGPYNSRTNALEIDSEDEATGWDSLPDKKDVNKVFKALLLQAEAPPPLRNIEE